MHTKHYSKKSCSIFCKSLLFISENMRKSLITRAYFSTICHFPHSCAKMNCGSEVHGKDEILSRGIPVHWRSCVRNTLFSISGFKRTTPHFLVWAESAVNFQNNTDVILVVQFVMAKSAVKTPKAQQQQKQGYHPVAGCTQYVGLWFTCRKLQ